MRRLRDSEEGRLDDLTPQERRIFDLIGEGYTNRQIAQDMRFHYVLGYTPSNDNYDGRFRNVRVKVRRGGTVVHFRRGYFAVRARTSNPVLSYEAPAIAVRRAWSLAAR